ncbi:MAG: GTP-binding protein [Rhodocyclaceae bacterium]
MLIETTGLADPAPVIHTLMSDPFRRATAATASSPADATHAMTCSTSTGEGGAPGGDGRSPADHESDLADAAQCAALSERLAALNPGARQIEIAGGAAPVEAVLGCGLYDPAGKTPDVAAFGSATRPADATSVRSPGRRAGAPAVSSINAGRHDAGIDSFVFRFDAPLQWFDFSEALGLLLQVYGARILRIKGLLNVAGDPRPRVLQCVQHSVYPGASLPAWPDEAPYDDRRSRLVFIVRDLPREEVEAILSSIGGQAPA